MDTSEGDATMEILLKPQNYKFRILNLNFKQNYSFLQKLYEYQGLPWWSSGEASVLPLQGAWVQSLVRELRSHMSGAAAKKLHKYHQHL